MKHELSSDELIDRAAGYALGSLSQREAQAFEAHLLEGCESCRDELESFEEVIALLDSSAAGEAPSIKVREKLLVRLNDESNNGRAAAAGQAEAMAAAHAAALTSIRAGEGEWQAVLDGVLCKVLYTDEASGLTTSIVKMLPGTSLPMHQHSGVEQFFVIEGDCRVHGEILGPGDYHRADRGSIHKTTYTENGTLFLLIAPAEYQVICEQ